MNYKEYKNLVKEQLPHIPVDELVTAGHVSPPELVTMVAVQLFITQTMETTLAHETRRQLLHRGEHGIMDW